MKLATDGRPELRLSLFTDALLFARHLVASEDIDPLYPILRWVERGMSTEQALWLTFLYLSYYNLPSALRAFADVPWPRPELPEHLVGLPKGTERRGLRQPAQFAEHVASYYRKVEAHEGQEAFLRWNWDGSPVRNYLQFWKTSQSVYGDGRWAAFKWAELLKEVHGWPLAAPDMRLQYCTGPLDGLRLLFGMPYDGRTDLNELNACADDLREHFDAYDVKLSYERLETVLCNYKSLHNGRYYVGHDIDELQHTIDRATSSPESRCHAVWGLWEARRRTLPTEYLGELNGWSGVRRDLMTMYRDHRVVYHAGRLQL